MLWPIIGISTGLTVILSFIFAHMNIEKIKADWPNQRCNPLIIVAGYLYKPSDDTRTPGKFSEDNFNFCMKILIDEVMTIMTVPVKQALKLQLGTTGSLSGGMNIVRLAWKNLWDSFIKILEPFFKTFWSAGLQFRRIFERLLSAYKRIGAILMASLYAGLSLMNGMLSMYEFIKMVIQIIMAILVALFIILFIVLSPFVAAILLPVIVMMAQAGVDVPGADVFCLAPGSLVLIGDGDQRKLVPIQHVKLGSNLGLDCGTVTGILEVDGSDEPLYSLDGVLMSGSHIVWNSKQDLWIHASHSGAKKSSVRYEKLYVLNTSSSVIPLQSPLGSTVFVKDWEEIHPDDTVGEILWNTRANWILNTGRPTSSFKGELPTSVPLLGKYIEVKTGPMINVTIDIIAIGDKIWDSFTGQYTVVKGIYKAINSNHKNISDGNWVYSSDGNWVYSSEGNYFWGHLPPEAVTENAAVAAVAAAAVAAAAIGYQLITESGTFSCYRDNKEYILRDFTEVGSDRIDKTYAMVSNRINLTKYKYCTKGLLIKNIDGI